VSKFGNTRRLLGVGYGADLQKINITTEENKSPEW
jgi:hypothetical protein